MLSLINKLKKEKEHLQKEIALKNKTLENISGTLEMLVSNYISERNKMGLTVTDEMKHDLKLPAVSTIGVKKRTKCYGTPVLTDYEKMFIKNINEKSDKKKANDIVLELFRKNPSHTFHRLNIIYIFKMVKDKILTPSKDITAVGGNALTALLRKGLIEQLSDENGKPVLFRYKGGTEVGS